MRLLVVTSLRAGRVRQGRRLRHAGRRIGVRPRRGARRRRWRGQRGWRRRRRVREVVRVAVLSERERRGERSEEHRAEHHHLVLRMRPL